jgi:alcohol dehydrogenase (NADP+)
MKYLELSNKDKMPVLGLGTWKSGKGEVYGAVCDAIKMGYRHIDCASAYENEAEIGLAIKDCISDGIVKREDLWITSKLWNNMHGKDNVLVALKKSLNDLQLSYLDLYLIHWPIPLKPEINFPRKALDFYTLDEMPVESTWIGMEDAVVKGLTKHIGVSNFSIKKLKRLIDNSRIKPEVNQIELHPMLQQEQMLEFCKNEEIFLTAYSPLGSKDRAFNLKSKNDPDLLNDPIIVDIAKTHQLTPAQILIAWAIMRNTSVIPKSVNSQRLKENLNAAEIRLTDKDMESIKTLEKGYRFVAGKFWVIPGGPITLENLWD